MTDATTLPLAEQLADAAAAAQRTCESVRAQIEDAGFTPGVEVVYRGAAYRLHSVTIDIQVDANNRRSAQVWCYGRKWRADGTLGDKVHSLGTPDLLEKPGWKDFAVSLAPAEEATA